MVGVLVGGKGPAISEKEINTADCKGLINPMKVGGATLPKRAYQPLSKGLIYISCEDMAGLIILQHVICIVTYKSDHSQVKMSVQ